MGRSICRSLLNGEQLEDRFRQALRLLDRRRGHEHDQLFAADRDRVPVDRARRHRLARPRHRLPAPGPVHQVQRGVQALAAVVESGPGHREVILPAAGADAQHKPAARQLVERRRLLGQQHRLAGGGEEDVRHQADALGGAGRGSQRDQVFERRVGDSADGAQRREAKRLRVPRDLDQQPTVVEALVRIWKPESNFQAAYATGSFSSTRSSVSTLPSLSRICRRASLAMSTSWVTMTIVTWSSRLRSFRRSTSCCAVSVSTAPVGSSSRMSEGRLTIERAMATRCIWPPDSSLGLCLMRSLRPTRSMSSMARCLPAAPFFTYRSGSITFSSTFMPESRLYSWKTKPTLRARIFARWRSPSFVGSTSSMQRLPAVGFNSSPSRSSMVVLPLPDRPTTATNSPLSMSSVTPSRARMISDPRL